MIQRGIMIVLVAAGLAGCGPFKPRPRPPAREPAAAAPVWTPEAISQNPTGYLAYADAEVVRQISEREARRVKIAESRATVGARADALRQSIRDAANIRKRIATAIGRADDEGAWPIVFAGRRLTRDEATAITVASERFVQTREPLATEYDQALVRIDATDQALRGDIVELGRLREKLALDLERVRLNQGIAEVAELRQNLDALSGFASALAATTDNPLEDLAAQARPPAAEAELEALLGK